MITRYNTTIIVAVADESLQPQLVHHSQDQVQLQYTTATAVGALRFCVDATLQLQLVRRSSAARQPELQHQHPEAVK